MVKKALVLCGGGSKGAFEVGVLKILLQKWVPDVVIGTSVGAINGAVLLDGPNVYENIMRLENIWLHTRRKDFFNFNKQLLYKLHLASSFYSNSNMIKFLRKWLVARKFEDLSLPLYVNCTRLRDGHNIFFHSGSLIEPIVASCTSPPLLPPFRIEDDYYFDGSLGSYIGIDLLKQNNYKKIVIINLINNHAIENSNNIIDVSRHSLEIIKNSLIQREIELCKGKEVATISMHLNKNLHMLDFSYTKELIKLGEEEAKKLLKREKL